ncbi:MAG: hypothetical protein PVI59_12595 [Anaerolineae bacterium]|jgi:hypothetical protein
MTQEKKDRRADNENPEEIIDDIVSLYDKIQSDFMEGAIFAGQEKERYEAMRPVWEELSKRTTVDPDEAELYTSGVRVLAYYRDELREFQPKAADFTERFGGFASASNSTASTTAGTASIVSSGSIRLPVEVTLPARGQFAQTETRLKMLDETLSDTYASVREVLYGTQSDPDRGALYLTRQIFDHFFSLLAPDDLVRKSKHWRAKPDSDKPNRVTRRERVVFAANTHVRDSSRRSTLIESADHLIRVYKILNKAHKRGNLDSEQARDALREIFALINSWIRSIDLPLSSLESSA